MIFGYTESLLDESGNALKDAMPEMLYGTVVKFPISHPVNSRIVMSA